jgi:hypothetical protein
MYTIYALVDPRDLLIHYVGMTQNHPVERMIQHWRNQDDYPTVKTEWIKELKKVSGKPNVLILQHVADEEQARQRERFWIKQGIDNGWPLVNLADGAERRRKLIVRRECNPLPPRPLREPVELKWETVLTAWFAANPQALTGPPVGISDLARAMAAAEGNSRPHTAYKGLAHKLFHAFRKNVRLPSGDPLGVDVTTDQQ